jgi:hypothetical protein
MTLVDKRELEPVYAADGPGCLYGSQIAAITEDRQQVSLASPLELALEPGDRTEMTSPVEPVFGVNEGVENFDWFQAFLDQRKRMIQALRVGCRLHGRQNRLAMLEAKITVVWEPPICRAGPLFQLVAEMSDERFRTGCNAGLVTVAGQLAFDLLRRQQLEPVVPELVAFRNTQVSGLEVVGYLGNHTQFK